MHRFPPSFSFLYGGGGVRAPSDVLFCVRQSLFLTILLCRASPVLAFGSRRGSGRVWTEGRAVGHARSGSARSDCSFRPFVPTGDGRRQDGDDWGGTRRDRPRQHIFGTGESLGGISRSSGRRFCRLAVTARNTAVGHCSPVTVSPLVVTKSIRLSSTI